MLARSYLFTMTLLAVAGCSAPMQRAGQSATVQFGVVRSAEQITLDSNAAQGALVGGMLGLARSGSNSATGTAVNTLGSAALGAAAAGAMQGDRSGMSYTVAMLDGSTKRIVTDQREIHEGDCVAIERVGDTANIRRAAAGYCDSANRQAVNLVVASARSEAVECASAKQELADATTTEEADLAIRKIELLCDS